MKRLALIVVACMMILALAVASYADIFVEEEAFGEVKFSIGKRTADWVADGKITDGEYFEVPIDPAWMSYAINGTDPDGGLAYAQSIQYKLYMSWDENNVYMATAYTCPDGYECLWDDDLPSMWQSGAIQVNYANFDEVASEYRLEYGIGRSTDTGNMLYTVWADGCGSGYVPSEDDNLMFIDGNNVIAETKCPWDAFADEDNTGRKEGNGFNFCIVWSVGFGGDYIHAQLAEGCTGAGKHAENFAQVTLAAAAPAAAAPAEEEGSTVILHGTPVIDGQLDDMYKGSACTVLDNFAFYTKGYCEDGTSAEGTKTYMLWDENYLYSCTVIHDTTTAPLDESLDYVQVS